MLISFISWARIICWVIGQMELVVKICPANAGDTRDVGLIPGLRRSPGIGNGNPFQYSCLENPMYREAWQVTVHKAAQSRTCWNDLALMDTPFISQINLLLCLPTSEFGCSISINYFIMFLFVSLYGISSTVFQELWNDESKLLPWESNK